MNSLTDEKQYEKSFISPFNEVVAYEALWTNRNASFKTISELFKSDPEKLPSHFVKQDDIDLLYPKIKDLFMKTGARYRPNVLINRTWDYPKKLKAAIEPVEVIYYSGNIELLNTPSVAIVGSRNPSEEGLKRTSQLVKRLVKDNFTIVSGLAKGIDSMAHETAISVGGKTIAVIGTPLNETYPKENYSLQDYIAKNHLLISQVPFYRYSQQTFKGNRLFFPERNKTMSALTEATIIIEAGETSGTLIQATAAIKQGRLLFILDSCFKNPNITWPARYEAIGAIRVETYDDIIKHLIYSR
ncbi:DNA-processing protein DprA [Pedobacter panaciterrae]